MRRLIAALFGLIGTGYNAYMNTRARFFANVGLLFFLILFQWTMNYWGIPLVNVLIFFALFVYTCYFWSDPAVIATVEALEVLRKDESKKLPPLDENYYRLYLAYVLLWLSIVSMFVVTLPFGWYLNFREAFTLTLTGLIFLSIIAWTAFFKWTKITIYKKVIKTYTYVGFVVCVWILIPASLKYWATGMDFYGAAGTSKTAKEFSKTGREVAKAIDQYNAGKIAEIGKKLMEGTNPTPEERKFWIDTEKNLRDNSLPNLISDNISRIDFSKFRLTPQVQVAKSQEISQPIPQSVQLIAPAVKAQLAPAVAPTWTIFAEKTVQSDEWEEVVIVDERTFYKVSCEGDCINTKIKTGYAELPAGSGYTLLIAAGATIYAKGGGEIKIFKKNA